MRPAWAQLRRELFKVAQAAYAAEGFPGEEQFHHQGGQPATANANGSRLRNGTETVVNNQAFAWNPSIRGGKAEDTVILRDGKIECLTATPELPVHRGEGAMERPILPLGCW